MLIFTTCALTESSNHCVLHALPSLARLWMAYIYDNDDDVITHFSTKPLFFVHTQKKAAPVFQPMGPHGSLCHPIPPILFDQHTQMSTLQAGLGQIP